MTKDVRRNALYWGQNVSWYWSQFGDRIHDLGRMTEAEAVKWCFLHNVRFFKLRG